MSTQIPLVLPSLKALVSLLHGRVHMLLLWPYSLTQLAVSASLWAGLCVVPVVPTMERATAVQRPKLWEQSQEGSGSSYHFQIEM